eukprot:3486683-Alexandrium_andersonii.AAC.1
MHSRLRPPSLKAFTVSNKTSRGNKGGANTQANPPKEPQPPLRRQTSGAWPSSLAMHDVLRVEA